MDILLYLMDPDLQKTLFKTNFTNKNTKKGSNIIYT